LSRPPVLDDADADTRHHLLAELQDALTGLAANCMLERHHRLVLRYDQTPPEPSGPTDPQLRIFTPDGITLVTTDGTAYRLGNGKTYPATDPVAAAAAICGQPAPATT
jgi:hypothetical protein